LELRRQIRYILNKKVRIRKSARKQQGGWEVMDNKILVSIAVLTYNHEHYLREALDSILMQQVDFTYEVVVGDDCSTDQTRVILETYERNHPGIFKVLYRTENIGTTRNAYDVFTHCEGQYIAQLEGDDFWTDPHKLLKQVQFLESHEQYIAVAHSCNVLCEDIALKESYEAFYDCRDGAVFEFADYIKKPFAGHTCTMLYRNIFCNDQLDYRIFYEADHFIGDQTLNLLLVMQGKVFCMAAKMSTYRLISKVGAENFASQSLKSNPLKQRWNYLSKISEYSMHNACESLINVDIRTVYWFNSLKALMKDFNTLNYEIFGFFTKMVFKSPSMLLHLPTNVLKQVKTSQRRMKVR